MSVYTADDMVALLQQLPYVVGDGCAVIRDSACARAFVSAAVVTRNILSVLKLRSVEAHHLELLENEIKKMGGYFSTMQEALKPKDRVEIVVPKFHSTCHFPFFIRRFGCALNFDSGTHERFHRDVVVAPFAMDARREMGQLSRMYEMNNERALLSFYCRSVKHTTATPNTETVQWFQMPVGNIGTCLKEFVPAVARVISSVLDRYFGLMHATALRDGGEAGIVYGKYVIDYGTEKILFVNCSNYLGKGCRSDCVEVAIAGEPPSPAEVVWYFEDLVKRKMVLVKWFKPIDGDNNEHRLLRVKSFARSPPTVASNYTICDVDSISGHAHMVPDYDSPSRIFWDVVNF